MARRHRSPTAEPVDGRPQAVDARVARNQCPVRIPSTASVARNVRVAMPAVSAPADEWQDDVRLRGQRRTVVVRQGDDPARAAMPAAAATTSRVPPEAEIATSTRSSAGGVGLSVEAYSVQAVSPPDRSSAAAVSAA